MWFSSPPPPSPLAVTVIEIVRLNPQLVEDDSPGTPFALPCPSGDQQQRLRGAGQYYGADAARGQFAGGHQRSTEGTLAAMVAGSVVAGKGREVGWSFGMGGVFSSFFCFRRWGVGGLTFACMAGARDGSIDPLAAPATLTTMTRHPETLAVPRRHLSLTILSLALAPAVDAAHRHPVLLPALLWGCLCRQRHRTGPGGRTSVVVCRLASGALGEGGWKDSLAELLGWVTPAASPGGCASFPGGCASSLTFQPHFFPSPSTRPPFNPPAAL
jgi:hypothetical protein